MRRGARNSMLVLAVFKARAHLSLIKLGLRDLDLVQSGLSRQAVVRFWLKKAEGELGGGYPSGVLVLPIIQAEVVVMCRQLDRDHCRGATRYCATCVVDGAGGEEVSV